MSTALLVQDASQSPDAAGSRPAAVGVDAYRGNYEGPKSEQEARYDSSIWSAYANKESEMGGLEGSWVVSDGDGHKLVGLELRSDHQISGQLEGAWRAMQAGYGLNTSGFISNLSLTGRDLEINYMPGRQRSPNILQVHRDASGAWRGNLLNVQGEKTPIVMTKATAG
ncbi:hypothetical protein [Asticcacaulis solisilvae]|uniref:hypothetical protein n=1 Tax=Asticcacaulis solisilvae TaxID=1217274 RepID=UPI003FD7F2C2